MPQASIRFFLIMIGGCALGMYTFRAALVESQSWAKIVALMIATVIGCFLFYAALFLAANLFAFVTSPLVAASQSRRDPSERDHADNDHGET